MGNCIAEKTKKTPTPKLQQIFIAIKGAMQIINQLSEIMCDVFMANGLKLEWKTIH